MGDGPRGNREYMTLSNLGGGGIASSVTGHIATPEVPLSRGIRDTPPFLRKMLANDVKRSSMLLSKGGEHQSM